MECNFGATLIRRCPKPSSFTNFNEDNALCRDAGGNVYDSILFFSRIILNTNFDEEDAPELGFDSPYDIDSPEKCAVQCAKAGFVNFVGFNYGANVRRFDPSNSRGDECSIEKECPDDRYCNYNHDPNPICELCPGGPDGFPNERLQELCERYYGNSVETKAECLQCPELEPRELFETMTYSCRCLAPEGAIDCSGYDRGEYDRCGDGTNGSGGDGTGPIMFAAEIKPGPFPPYYEPDQVCIRNDNFDPSEPTLVFPDATAA